MWHARSEEMLVTNNYARFSKSLVPLYVVDVITIIAKMKVLTTPHLSDTFIPAAKSSQEWKFLSNKKCAQIITKALTWQTKKKSDLQCGNFFSAGNRCPLSSIVH